MKSYVVYDKVKLVSPTGGKLNYLKKYSRVNISPVKILVTAGCYEKRFSSLIGAKPF